MIAVIAPLFAQILCSNASKAAIVTAWVLTVAFFNAGHWIVGASSEIYVYINLTFLFVMYSSYEIESSFVERFFAHQGRSARPPGFKCRPWLRTHHSTPRPVFIT